MARRIWQSAFHGQRKWFLHPDFIKRSPIEYYKISKNQQFCEFPKITAFDSILNRINLIHTLIHYFEKFF